MFNLRLSLASGMTVACSAHVYLVIHFLDPEQPARTVNSQRTWFCSPAHNDVNTLILTVNTLPPHSEPPTFMEITTTLS
ncbi:hypothetical protein BJ165DRAFT_1447836 [Panaeolus papilionaceus]|nr:hypothetical protein BJ165DRAFT_1447836 [Panaeolus papilionaceus]